MALDPKTLRDIHGERDTLFNPFPTAKEYKPDEVAEGLKIGRVKSIDGLVAAENLPQLKEELDQDKWDEIVKRTPKLAKKMQTPAFAAVAHDDTENLGLIEGTLKRIPAKSKYELPYVEAQMQADFRAQRLGLFPESIFNDPSGVVQAPARGTWAGGIGAKLKQIPEMLRQGIRLGAADALGFEGAQADALKKFERSSARADYEDPSFNSSLERNAYGAVNSAIRTLPAIGAGVATRNPTVAYSIMAADMAPQIYAETRARGGSGFESLANAGLQTGTEIISERIPMGFLVDRLGKAGTGEFIKGYLGRELPTEIAAELAQGALDTAIANPNVTWGDYVDSIPDTVAQTAMATLLVGGGLTGLNTVARQFAGQEVAAQEATQQRETLATMDQLSAASVLRARDPETFKQFIASAIEDGPIQDVYIDAQAIASSGQAEALAQVSPAVQEQLLEALQTGGSVRIPLDEYTAAIAGTDLNQGIIDHVKLDPEGMTFAESQTFQQTYQEEFNRQVELATAEIQGDENFKASAAEVKTVIKDQLNAVGHTSPNVNETYATMASSYYAVRAAQLGVSPKELFDSMPLNVTGERVTGGLDQANAQIETPQFKEWFGDSKVVDGEGKPLVVYHGTDQTFEQFEGISWFTTSAGDASKYSEIITPGKERTPNVMPVYIKLKKPKYMDMVALRQDVEKVKAAGKHDGIIVRNVGGGDKTYYISFNPEQIKSATGNNGDFNPNDPNILRQTNIGVTGTAPDDFVTFNGNVNIAEITVDLGKAIKRQAGVIRLNVGVHNKDGKGYGKEHIEARHAAQIRGAGFDNVENYVTYLLNNTTEIWQAGAGQLLFVARDTSNNVMFLQLQPAKDKAGDYYRINSALPVRNEDYAKRKGMVLLWKGSEPASIVSGQQSEFAVTPDKAGQADPNAYSQSSDSVGGRAVKVNSTPINRGAYNPTDNTIALLKNADLSTFLHELGHAFLTMDASIAGQLLAKEVRTEAEQQVLADMKTVFDWFGLEGDIPTQLGQWNSLSVDEQRDSHEKFAEGFEAYLFEGKAPSLELQSIFQRFRAWLSNVYRNLSKYLSDAGETLTPEVRAVFDRMLATSEQIKQAQQARGMAPLFTSAEEAGMTDEQFRTYTLSATESAQDAISELEAKSLRDMTWTSRLKARTVERLNKEAAALRREVRIESRREVLQEPLYKAWQFLTGRITEEDKLPPPPPKSKDLDPTTDSLFEAIAKLGGLNKEKVISEWGIDPADKPSSGIFGKPLWRVEGGLTVDGMAELLAQYGYIQTDENGKYDLTDFEDKFKAENAGELQFSYAYNYTEGRGLPFSNENLETIKAARLERADVVRILGEAGAAKLDKRGMLRKTGLAADTVADLFGFTSGDALVRALVDANPISKEIEDVTDVKMLEQHGELSSPEAISKAADAAIHNDVRTRVIATELAGLQKALGSVQALSRMAKEYARIVVGKTKVKDLRPNKFAVDAARAGKAADKAMRKGEREEAITQKRNQLVNHVTTKAAYEAQTEVGQIQKEFRRIVTAKIDNLKATHNLDLVNATRAILAEYGIGTRGQKPREYVELIKAYDPELYAAIEPEIRQAEADAREIRDLSIDELRALRDQVGSLWYLARREKQVEIDGKMVDRNMVVNALESRLMELGLPDTVPGQTQAVTKQEKAGRALRGFRAALRRVEAWVDRMDSGKIDGAFRKYLFTPISEAADNYRADSIAYIGKFRDLLKTIEPSLVQGRIAAPELGYTFGGETGDAGLAELLHAILHTGNESNKRKLLLGRGWATDNDGQLDTSRWDRFINRMIQEGKLDKTHFDFAQGVWDLLEETKPLAQKTHREVFGRYFAEVTADEFTTPFGTYRGGYVPAVTDTYQVQDAAINQALEETNAGNAYMFPATSRGFTKSRVEYNKPLALDLRLLPQHIDKVLLFANMERHVRDVNRVLRNAQGTLTRYDPAAYQDMLLPWLNRAARQTVSTPLTGAAGKAIDRFFSKVRSRAGMSVMFANLTNALQQITGFSIAALKVDGTYIRQATAEYIRDPKGMAENAATLSTFMDERLNHQSFTLRSEIEELLLNPSAYEKTVAWSQKHAYFLQATFQNVVDTITWTGAYNQALAKGETEANAIRAGNAAVRETQGSLQPEDISRFESGPTFVRLFTQFASYFNMQANVLGTEFAIVSQDMGLRKGAGKAFYIMLFGFLAPAWAAEAIVRGMRGGAGDGDDEYLDEWLSFIFGAPARNAAAMVPIAGQFANRAAAGFTDERYDDRMATAPAISVIESALSAPSSIYKAIVDDGRSKPAIKDALSVITLTTGIPASSLGRPLGYAADMAEGKVVPTSDADMARGLVTGVPSTESRR